MLTIGRGQHGSTYGGNPVAAKVALAALRVLVDERLAENSYSLGQLLRRELQAIQSPIITEVRDWLSPSGCVHARSAAEASLDSNSLLVHASLKCPHMPGP
jgi:acetylornithine/succinyldiaminopimelate/putrescine aminotransferase